jgi:hypothetical protein
MAQALTEERDDVTIVEGVEDHASFASRSNESQVSQQAQLVRDSRLRHSDEGRQIAHAQLAVRQRIQHADTGRIAERTERFGKVGNVVLIDQRRAQLGDAARMEVNDFTKVGGGPDI